MKSSVCVLVLASIHIITLCLKDLAWYVYFGCSVDVFVYTIMQSVIHHGEYEVFFSAATGHIKVPCVHDRLMYSWRRCCSVVSEHYDLIELHRHVLRPESGRNTHGRGAAEPIGAISPLHIVPILLIAESRRLTQEHYSPSGVDAVTLGEEGTTLSSLS